MMSVPGGTEWLFVIPFALLSFAIPIATLIGVFLTYWRVTRIERFLNLRE
jgi:hypothetical protein